jgi:hypothetical protein
MSDRLKELTDDILNKLSKGYRLVPNHLQQGKNAMTTNVADSTIDAPFEEAEDTPLVLTADNIITRTEKDGETLAYEVEHNGELLFSTVSRPLAFAWIGGFNSQAQTGTKASAHNTAPDKASPADPAPLGGGAATIDPRAPTIDPARISASKAANANNDKDASLDKAGETNQQPQSRKRTLL